MRIELIDDQGSIVESFTAKDWSGPKAVTFKGHVYTYDHPLKNGPANLVGHSYRLTHIEEMSQFIAVGDEKRTA